VRTFLPTSYEPNYAYPLLVFFHGQGGSEEQILELAPRVSRRNFICISLRGPHRAAARGTSRVGYAWDADNPTDALTEDYVFRAIEQTRRTYHVHSERIYLAGFCEGAAPAYRVALAHPDRFGGLVALNGAMPRPNGPLFRFDAIRRFPVFIGHGIANVCVPFSTARRDFFALYTAGANAEMRSYLTTHRLHADMLRDVNRWIIERCNRE
jgi:phospholipase/carboxylesterase